MKILHTSDIHLNENRPETLSSLTEILAVCKELSADLLTVGGDLFDSEGDAEALRPRLRDQFSSNDFPIIVIPGNHDREAYAGNLDFGSDLKVVTERPFGVLQFGKISVVGLPYIDNPSEELYSQLKESATNAETRILLLHCTLDIGFGAGDFGEEDAPSYFPISAATLSSLGFKYVLAGHFHSETQIRNLENGGVFVYPGSPVSHTTGELGKRQAVLIDTETGDTRPVPLNTFYHDRLPMVVRPGKEDRALGEVKKWVEARLDDRCDLEITVKGHIEVDEKEFGDSLSSLGKNIKVRKEYRNVKSLLEYPLFQRFKEKLQDRADIEDKQEVETMAIDVMSRLLAERELGP